MLCKRPEPTKATVQISDTFQSFATMYPNKVDKRKGETVSRSQGFSPQEGQEGNAQPSISCCFRRLDRQARQSLALGKAPTRILPASFSSSRGRLPAQPNLKIVEEDIQEDRRAAKDLVRGLRGSYQLAKQTYTNP